MRFLGLATAIVLATGALAGAASAQPYGPPPPPPPGAYGPPPPPHWVGPHYYWRHRHWHNRVWAYDRFHHGYWRYY